MVSSWIRIAVGLVYMALASAVHAVVLLVLLPSRYLRQRSCNLWGWVTGRFCLWLSGSTVTIEGAEHLSGAQPAIFVSNHTSMLDIFLGIGFSPLGTVGVAKKEVVFYPFFGQLYWLSGHLRIDRGNHAQAVRAMKKLEGEVKRYRSSIWMWPEGTRSKTGRLLPFKKGIVHLAVATGLPVVPVVVSGAQKAMAARTLRIQPASITVRALPPVDTSDWKDRPIDDVLTELHAQFVAHLPDDQKPLDAAP